MLICNSTKPRMYFLYIQHVEDMWQITVLPSSDYITTHENSRQDSTSKRCAPLNAKQTPIPHFRPFLLVAVAYLTRMQTHLFLRNPVFAIIIYIMLNFIPKYIQTTIHSSELLIHVFLALTPSQVKHGGVSNFPVSLKFTIPISSLSSTYHFSFPSMFSAV